MIHQGDFPDTRKPHNIAEEGEPGLRESERIVPVFSTEPGEAGLLAVFDPSKKALIGAIDPLGDVLEDLGVDGSQPGVFGAHFWKIVLLIPVSEPEPIGVVDLDSFLQKIVVQVSTCLECLDENRFLGFGRIQPILERLLHGVYCTKIRGLVSPSWPAA
ncbi:MAG: hypothetical protein M1537_03980 [Nitrospirae bacterium]|nr:hypothetical protein [Nitrospirota bacterium]